MEEEEQAVESPREEPLLEEKKEGKKGAVIKRKTSVNKRNGGSSLPTPKVDIWQRNEMEKHRKMKEANLKRAKETQLKEKNQQDREEQDQKDALKKYKEERKEAYEKYLRANNRKNEENYLRQKPAIQNAYNKVNVQMKENFEDSAEETSEAEKQNQKKSKRQWMPRPVPLDNAEQHLREQQIEKELYENQIRQVQLMKQRNALGGGHSIVEEDEREEGQDISYRDKDMKQSQFTIKGEEHVYVDSEDERESKFHQHNNKSSVNDKQDQKRENNEDYYNDKHLSIVESTYDIYGQKEEEETGFFGFGGQVLAKVSGDEQEKEEEKGRYDQKSKKSVGSVVSQESKNKRKKQSEDQRAEIDLQKNSNNINLTAQRSPSYSSKPKQTIIQKNNEDLPWPLNEINQQNERYSSPKPFSYPSAQDSYPSSQQIQESIYQQSPQQRPILPPLSSDFTSQQKSTGFSKQFQKPQLELQENAKNSKNNLDEYLKPKSISAIQQQYYNPLTSNDLAQLKLKQEQLIKEKAEQKRTEQINSQNPQIKPESNTSALQQTQLIEDFKQQFNDLKKEYNYHRQQSKNLIASKEQKERQKQNLTANSKQGQLASPKDISIVRKTQQSQQRKQQGGYLDEEAELQYEQGEENDTEEDINAQLFSQSGRIVRRTNHFKDVSKFSKKSLLDQQNSTQSSQLSYAQNMKERRKFWEKNTQENFLNQPIEEKAKITAISKFRSKLNNKISSDKQLNMEQQEQLQQQQKQDKKISEAQEWKALNEQEIALQREILSMHLDNFEKVKQVEDKNNISLANAVNNSEIMKSRVGSAVSNVTTKTNKTSKSKVSSITTAEKARGSLKQINPISEIENEDDLEASLMKLEEQLNQKKNKITELADDLAQQLKPKNPELQRILSKNPAMLEQNPFSVDLTNQDKEYLENQKRNILMIHQQQSSPVINSKNTDDSRFISRESRESRLQPKNIIRENIEQQQSVSSRERKQWDVKSKAGSTVRSSSNSLLAGRQQLSSAAKDIDRLDTKGQYQSNTRLTDQSPIVNRKQEEEKHKHKKGTSGGQVNEVEKIKLNPEIIEHDKEELTKWWKSMQGTSESKNLNAGQTPKDSRYNTNVDVSSVLRNNTMTVEGKDIKKEEEQNALRRKQQLKAEFLKQLEESETNELTTASRNATGDNSEQTQEGLIQTQQDIKEQRGQQRSQVANEGNNDESISMTPPLLRKKLTDVLDKNLIAKVEYSQTQIEQTIQSTLQRIEAVERQQIKADLENKKKQLSQNNKENGQQDQNYAGTNNADNPPLDCQLSEISHNASFADSEFSVVSGVGSYQTKQTIKKQFKLTGKVPSRYPHSENSSLSRNNSFQENNSLAAGLQQIAEKNEYKEIILEEEDQGDIKINKNVNLKKLLFVDD